jgi:hypothetical protein
MPHPSNPRSRCPFCEPPAPLAVEVPIVEDRLVRVVHPLSGSGRRTYLGIARIQTRRHTPEGLPSLTEAEGERIGRLVAQLSRAFRHELGAAWTYTYCFTEAYRHVHQFVVARYPGTPSEKVRLDVTDWAGAPRGSPREVRRVARAIARRLAPGPLGPEASVRGAVPSGRRPGRG